ncbi:MAG TPA: hypothetical protein VL358_01080, partial [Caulobacteraceae bacterium]|nr:hypothetical protein [Caulobacteraceae bacterium]
NSSGERLVGGEFKAYGRSYPFGPIESGGSVRIGFRAPTDRSDLFMVAHLASGKTLRGMGFVYVPWLDDHSWVVTANGVAEQQ